MSYFQSQLGKKQKKTIINRKKMNEGYIDNDSIMQSQQFKMRKDKSLDIKINGDKVNSIFNNIRDPDLLESNPPNPQASQPRNDLSQTKMELSVPVQDFSQSNSLTV